MESGNRILFYKTSVLKSTPVTVYYDLHLLGEVRVKKMKVEQQEELLKFGFSCQRDLHVTRRKGILFKLISLNRESLTKLILFFIFSSRCCHWK